MSTHASRPTTMAEVRARQAHMLTREGFQRALTFQPQPTDVIITPYAKSGTTWVQQIVHGLRTRGDMQFDEITSVIPWIEMAYELGMDLDQPQRGQPRVFKSHFSWDLVPKGARYIYVIRDLILDLAARIPRGESQVSNNGIEGTRWVEFAKRTSHEFLILANCTE